MSHRLFFLVLVAAELGRRGFGQDLLPDWREGLPNEVAGVWVGDEKFIETEDEDEPYVDPYCSRAIFTPRENFLLWLSAPGTCEDNGINAHSGSINGKWFRDFDSEEIFIEQVQQYQCLPSSFCDDFDITKDYDSSDPIKFKGWDVQAKACLQLIKKDNVTPDLYYCETVQVNLLKKR